MFQYESYADLFREKTFGGSCHSVYTEADAEATTLEVVLLDKVIQMEIILSYTIYEEPSCDYEKCQFLRNREKKK